MGKVTKNELKKRKAELKQMVHADIVKREVMQFRLEPDNIERLYGIALQKRKPVGTLVREWITDRINAELDEEAKGSVLAALPFDQAIAKLRSELQEPLDKLRGQISVFENLAKEARQSRRK